jgi:hypothetical protein
MPNIFIGSYLEHFELKRCDVANESTFFYCVHPKIDCTKEQLQQFCVHCITIELLKTDAVFVIDGRLEFKRPAKEPEPSSLDKEDDWTQKADHDRQP